MNYLLKDETPGCMGDKRLYGSLKNGQESQEWIRVSKMDRSLHKNGKESSEGIGVSRIDEKLKNG